MKPAIFLALSSLLLVTACSSREEADAKLRKGCEYGVRTLLEKPNYDRQIGSVKSASFENVDAGRRIVLDTVVKNKEYGYENDETFSCIFSETYSFGFIAWNANLEQIKVGDDVFGRENGQIKGDLQDFMKVTDEIERAMQ